MEVITMARNEMLFVRCTKEEIDEIKQKAQRKAEQLNVRMTMSDYIRHLIKADK